VYCHTVQYSTFLQPTNATELLHLFVSLGFWALIQNGDMGWTSAQWDVCHSRYGMGRAGVTGARPTFSTRYECYEWHHCASPGSCSILQLC